MAPAAERPAPALFGHLYAPRTTAYAPRFLYDADHFSAHWVLRADRSLFDLPTSRRTRFGRTTDVGTVPGTLDGGNAAVELQRFRRPGRLVALVDSFGRPFAYLRQSPSSPESITVYTQRRKRFDRTLTAPTAAAPFVPATDPTKLYLQGRGCMADRRASARYAIVGLSSGNATAPGNAVYPPDMGAGGRYIGLRGFVALRDLPATIDDRSTARLAATHDVGCGPRDLRVPRGAGSVRPIAAHQGWDRFGDLYLGSRSWRACPLDPSGDRPDPESPGCGTPYGQYEAPAGLTPPGDEVALLTANTTGVTGIHAGAVRALYRSGAFRQVDEIAYADPNVPCAPGGGAGERRARWVFGDANPHPKRGQGHLWGWRPVRVAEPPGGDWRALTVGIDAWRCGDPPPGTPPARPALDACPPSGARVLAGDGSVQVYRQAGTTWVCEPSTAAAEELDDPATGETLLAAPAFDAHDGRVAEVVLDAAAAEPGLRRVLAVLDVAAYVGRAASGGVAIEAPLTAPPGSVRLYRSGAAYIDCPSTCRVHAVTPAGDRIVARGRDIDPRSLRVVAGRLRWKTR